MIEAGVRKIEAEEVFPVDPRPDGLRRSTIAQALAELEERDQSQAPRRVGWLAQAG